MTLSDDEKLKLAESEQDYLAKQRQIKALRIFMKGAMIPVMCNRPGAMNENYHKAYLEQLGFRVDAIKDGFFYCKFPRGWKKLPAGGDSHWCYLYDDKRRKRAAIFYKFLQKYPNGNLDVSTFINYMTRFRARSYTDPKDANHFIGDVLDSETTIIHKDDLRIMGGLDDDVYKMEKQKALLDLFTGCEGWLKKTYPEFMNISAYWNEK